MINATEPCCVALVLSQETLVLRHSCVIIRVLAIEYVIHDAERPHGCVDRRFICRQFMQRIYSGLIASKINSGRPVEAMYGLRV